MQKTESIILSKRPLGEADILISFFGKDVGLLKGVARHAKKSKRRFGGILETGYVLNLNYKDSSRSDLVRVDEASLVSPRSFVGQSLVYTTSMWLAVEMAERFLPPKEVSLEKYELMRRFLMAAHEKRLTRPIMIYFLVKWVSLCGYQPDLGSGSWDQMGYSLDGKALGLLNRLMNGEIDVWIDDKLFKDLMSFIFHYIMVILERPLKLESYLPIFMEL